MEKKFLLFVVLLFIPFGKAQDCPDGYQEIDGSCYYFAKVSKTFDEATDSCADLGGELLEVDDAATRAIIDEYSPVRCVYWISQQSELVDYYQNREKTFKFICKAPGPESPTDKTPTRETPTRETPTRETPTRETPPPDDGAVDWPAFEKMKGNYPKLTFDQIVDQEGLAIKTPWLKDLDDDTKNSCAMCVSYALTKSGMKINVPDECKPKFKGEPNKWAGVEDKNGNPYFIRVAVVCCYLEQTIGKPAVTGKDKNLYKDKKGIIVFKECPEFKSATGHVDLWDGTDCCGQCYFDECNDISLYTCD